MKSNLYIIFFCLFAYQGLAAQYTRGVLPESGDSEIFSMPQRAPMVSRAYSLIPAKMSLRAYTPLPRNQGGYGNCTGWASAYCGRTILEAVKNNWTEKRQITNNAFSPGLTFRLGGGKATDCTGAYTTTVVRSLATHGAVLENRLPGMSVANECPQYPIEAAALSAAPPAKIPFPLTLWQPKYVHEKEKIARVKRAIAAKHPVVISMVAPKSFEGTDTGGSVGKNGLWTPETPFPQAYDIQLNCHAVTVIGYNDDQFGGSFEIQNSWGTEWGDSGYGFIKYQDFARYAYQGFEMFMEPSVESAPSPTTQVLAGSLRLYDVSTDRDLPVKLAPKTRNWTVGGGKETFTYEISENLRSGVKMRIYLESKQPAYVYLLGTGTENPEIGQLFPAEGYSPAMNYKDYQVALPSEDEFFIDNSTGTNYLLLVYAFEPLNISEIIEKLNRDKTKSVSSRLDKEIRDLLIEANDIQFADDEISFHAKMDGARKAFAMIIKSTHVE